jgi:hypothetical protein
MRYVAKQQFSSRWTDGRSLSVMEGTEGYVPDDDADAVAHVEALAKTGQVEILPEPESDEDEDQADDDETEQEEPAKAVTPAKTAAKAAPAKAAKAAPAKRAAK